MKDDICYYKLEQVNIYQKKYYRNLIVYLFSMLVFTGVNIILNLIQNNVIYLIVMSIIWIIYLNFSIMYLYFKLIKIHKVIKLYETMDYGNKVYNDLIFVRKMEEVVVGGLSYNSYLFKDHSNKEYCLYIYTFVEANFIPSKKYQLTLVNSYIYGSRLNE